MLNILGGQTALGLAVSEWACVWPCSPTTGGSRSAEAAARATAAWPLSPSSVTWRRDSAPASRGLEGRAATSASRATGAIRPTDASVSGSFASAHNTGASSIVAFIAPLFLVSRYSPLGAASCVRRVLVFGFSILVFGFSISAS